MVLVSAQAFMSRQDARLHTDETGSAGPIHVKTEIVVLTPESKASTVASEDRESFNTG